MKTIFLIQFLFINTVKVAFLILFCTLATFEWIEYSLTPVMLWPKSLIMDHHDAVKLLIVGDPQLLGNRNACPNFFGSVCRWDADRYIAKTFGLAHQYLNPDLVIFLGDNLDEGEIASDEEFHEYFQRFRKVFQDTNFDKAIIIPGDNDIGGEDESPLPYLEKRFNKYVNDDILFNYKFLEIVKVNYITHSNSYLAASNTSDSSYRIIVSHMPLTPVYSSFVSRALRYLQPHIILSAHDHKSVHLTADRHTGIQLPYPVTDLSGCLFNVTESFVHEIIVPTCSYRMGTHKMGYGALKIDSSGKVLYSVLPLPSRFRQIYTYLFVVSVIFIYVLLSLALGVIKISSQRSFSRFSKHSRLIF
ncbi:metallophosphoesterase 1-like isoform X2 [Uloborus diversus]|uniref:metallophosphoesterase 1-like isoform X2 n=1 Tax=Uloborus diversus TaxID=327109 RepID=UPI00240968BF|nr:metallophosphoesterase 1-like isoform X2 [Uloborus diversus]